MTSCEEATYFLQNCPGVKMDGNNDGVPVKGSGVTIDPAQNNVRPELVEGHSAWGFDKLIPNGINKVFKGRINNSSCVRNCSHITGNHSRRSAIPCRQRRSTGPQRREGIPDLQGGSVVGRQSFADKAVGRAATSAKNLRLASARTAGTKTA
ncbi:hypothetical protein sS8_2789 [Methylocaldum marinum]|uniref:Uncharacterized protein n=2 Tax=Methylocaldum marinum TaxID=1432792 RepID=A0A250KT98_9GAMM|nr:hypothetical protein sS8_2789 [Methylocaldum marinum]